MSLEKKEESSAEQSILLPKLLKLVTPVLETLKISDFSSESLTILRKSNPKFPEMKNDTFLRVFHHEKIDHIPVWMMRQAGRTLPEFNEIRKILSFFDLCDNPFASSEVTLQPLLRYRLDAAIIFSDILIIPKVMGLPYIMEPGKGPVCTTPIIELIDLKKLSLPKGDEKSLQANYDAIFLTRMGLEGKASLIGFCGTAWTLMTYMIENKEGNYNKVKSWINKYQSESKELLGLINQTLILHMSNQIEAGVQCIQIFDSSADLLSEEDYYEFSLCYNYELAKNLKNKYPDTPIILFPRGQYGALPEILTNPKYNVFDCISLDHGVNISDARKMGNLTNKILQGNLDPGVIHGNKEIIIEKTKNMIDKFGVKNYIANLGHGVWPNHTIENLTCFVDTVYEYSTFLLK